MAEPQEPEKTLERQMRAFHWVRLLAELPGRRAGSASEEEAALRVASWLRELGFEDVERQPVVSRPRNGFVVALHLGVGALGCWLGGGAGLVLAGLAAGSFQRELGGGRPLLTRLLPARDSRNVVARAGSRRPSQRVVLSAHLDAAEAGWLFSPAAASFFARRARGRDGAVRGPHALPRTLLWGAALLAAAAWLGADAPLLGAARGLLGLGLAAGAALTLQWALSPVSPGANDNASAVAAMLTAAEQLLARLPDDAELWVVGTGAEEVGCRGMRAFCEAHEDWPRAYTYFVNFECVGGGALHWVRSEGTLARTAFPPLLVELARRVAASGVFGEVTATDLMAGTDGHVPARAGFPSLSIISLEEDGVPRNYHRAEDLPEAVDLPTVIRAADFGAAVARAALRGEAGPIAIV